MSSSFHKQLKNFVLVTKQYSHCHDESSKNAVLCSLQVYFQIFFNENLYNIEFF